MGVRSRITVLMLLILLLTSALPAAGEGYRTPESFPPLTEEDLKQEIALNPSSPQNYQLWLYLGKKCFGDNNFPEAVKALKQAVQLSPTSAEAHFLLGKTYRLTAKYEEARQAFSRVTQLTPTDAWGHQFLGIVYMDLRRFQEAAEALSKAALLNPGLAERYYYHFDNVHGEFNTQDTMMLLQCLNKIDKPLAKLIWDNFREKRGSTFRNQEMVWPVPENR